MNAKTIRVRIAVAVDGTGYWNACGWSTEDDSYVRGVALEGLDGNPDVDKNTSLAEAVYWVEADIPVPADIVVEGQAGEQVTT